MEYKQSIQNADSALQYLSICIFHVTNALCHCLLVQLSHQEANSIQANNSATIWYLHREKQDEKKKHRVVLTNKYKPAKVTKKVPLMDRADVILYFYYC